MFNTRDENWYDMVLPQGITVQFPAWFRPTAQPDGALDAFARDGDRIATKPIGADFFDQTYYPYVDGYPDNYRHLAQEMPKIHWAGLAHSPWDHAGEPDFWQQLREKAVALRQTSDRALMVVAGCNLFEWGTFLRRMDNFLMDLVSDQDNVERLLDALMEIHLKTLENVCNAVGDVVDILRFGDDLGMDSGPFMAPRYLPETLQAPPQDFVRLRQRTQPDAHLSAFVRVDLPTAARSHRGWLRRHQPGADQFARYGSPASKRGIRR